MPLSDPTASRRFCSSSYLTFRHVVDPSARWSEAVPAPPLPVLDDADTFVKDAAECEAALRQLTARAAAKHEGRLGILLSGGIDSAILAAMLPPGTPAFSIRFVAEGGIDETVQAARYAEACGLPFHCVEVTWDDYQASADALMTAKRAPLHAVEVALFKAAEAARAAGVDQLMVGNGADSTFGGMDKLLSRDWSYDAFVTRYTFIEPASALRDAVAVHEPYQRYRTGDAIDFMSFLKVVHGLGIVQSFRNAIELAGVGISEPFEHLQLGAPLDLERIRAGEPKYYLYEIFHRLYPDLEAPKKIPFARPMDVWLKGWAGPQHPDFRADLDLASFTGDQRWLLWCLDRFLTLLDEGALDAGPHDGPTGAR